jgi:Holliday junction DNA helicase RuvB
LTTRLDYYEPADLQSIVTRAAGILKVDLDEDGAAEIARRSRGTPRIGNRLLRQVRDFAQVERSGVVDGPVARDGLAFFGVDSLGLDKPSREILSVMCRRFDGGPVGLKTLSISVSEPEDTVEDVYEPFLIQQGLLLRTPKGRVATPAAFDHLGMDRPAAANRGAGSLFEGRPDPPGRTGCADRTA